MLEHKCEVCGRMWRKKLIANGKVVCNKHYIQYHKFGEFRDTSSRTQRDKNNITIVNDVAYIDMYDKYYNVVAQAIIDSSDVDIVKYIKWRINCNGYVINNSESTMFLHRRILGTNNMVDHINGNKLDNRKSNLRIVTKSQNQMNVNYKGVYKKDNGKWCAKIKLNQKQLNLGTFDYEEEALYARWVAEKILFGEYAYNKEEPNIIQCRKDDIYKLIESKVQRLQ